MKKAYLVKQFADGEFSGEARLYRLDPPIADERSISLEDGVPTYEFVVVSAIRTAYDTGRPETFIFPSNSDGEVVSWLELSGSLYGRYGIEDALINAGYEPQPKEGE